MGTGEDEMTFDEQLAKLAIRIRATRKDKGLTLQEAATRGGWKHKQNWVHLEKGNGMTHRTLTRIARALDVSVADLINGGE